MEEINNIAEEHNLFVIEDTCQAIGADCIFSDGMMKKAGTIGHVSGMSFFPSKNLGCYGDGGAIFTNDDQLAQQLRVVVNHGMVVRYYHNYVGVNSRLDSIQAAVLKVKLQYLDDYIKVRQAAADFYDSALANHPKIITPFRDPKSTHVFHQYTLVTKDLDRDGLQKFLSSKNIPAMVYYPVPMHMQKAYQDPRYREGDFPVTEMLCKSVISLPIHTEMDEEQLKHITLAILEFANQ
jgi:dTDP-4-amino-4,6-dideoxygalactose transaminase